MSDDGVYADSPNNDEYDDYWDEDAVHNLADDLAEHATYSPVWQDTPVGELDPYYSDWEYYSDDYYDDDPAILKQNPLDGQVRDAKIQQRPAQPKRGRKRKLDDVREARMTDTETQSLVRSIQGTVWAQEHKAPTALFRQGDQGAVSLLTNWRDMFSGQDGSMPQRSRQSVDKDESWANDMSLAAMGLHQQSRQELHNGPSDKISSNDSESEASIDNDSGSPVTDQGPGAVGQAELSCSKISTDNRSEHQNHITKRRKLQELPSPPTSTESHSNRASNRQRSDEVTKHSPISESNGQSAVEKAVKCQTDAQSARVDTSQRHSKTISRSKKRRLSMYDEVESGPNPVDPESQQQTAMSSTTRQKAMPQETSTPYRRSKRLQKGAG